MVEPLWGAEWGLRNFRPCAPRWARVQLRAASAIRGALQGRKIENPRCEKLERGGWMLHLNGADNAAETILHSA